MKLLYKEVPYLHYEFIQKVTGDRLRIVPERGGLITEWLCNGIERLYFDRERFKDPTKSVRGGMPILFPICGDLPGDLLTLSSGNFILNQHGFARENPWDFELIDNEMGVLLSLRDNKQTLSIYPFEFLIEIAVRPLLNRLEINIDIHNNGEKRMPFSMGLHPYFLVKNLSKLNFLGLPEKCFNHLEMTETKIPTDQLSQGVDFLVKPNGPVTLVDYSDTGTQIELHNEPPMDLTVVWTDPPRPMVCLEPWTAPRQALNTGVRRIDLEPGTVQSLKCSFVVVD